MSLWKQSQFSHSTPLPPHITQESAIKLLHNHDELIRLNPLIVDYKPAQMPYHAPTDESHYTWYELTDRITYFPGLSRNVTYHAGFLDMPEGLQTHVFAPAGLEIRENWYISGPTEQSGGLTLCEDVDMNCNILLTSFVKKNLNASHATLTRRLLEANSSLSKE
ncbi:hypothetical protein K461DRAFT_290114 [Myriangium duriaei CBS 260.36]|uniref:DUF7053 domain-containing protein n=1 Tax=Myriangium duriaei CBS 260.36 TaxID=1168546 RepID=A0A9P4JDX9_9PEZI|nr:hypothetical protein K461DRAFT_290114 [Myriangium duriaei CBS 260.36]